MALAMTSFGLLAVVGGSMLITNVVAAAAVVAYGWLLLERVNRGVQRAEVVRPITQVRVHRGTSAAPAADLRTRRAG